MCIEHFNMSSEFSPLIPDSQNNMDAKDPRNVTIRARDSYLQKASTLVETLFHRTLQSIIHSIGQSSAGEVVPIG